MAMRTECRHYESRTYAGGEVVHRCRLDLAPEAPWRCPADCPSYAKRMGDVGWQYGSLVPSAPAPMTGPTGLDEHAAAVLDEAEDLVNAIGPELLAEFAQQEGTASKARRLLGRSGKAGKGSKKGKQRGKKKKGG